MNGLMGHIKSVFDLKLFAQIFYVNRISCAIKNDTHGTITVMAKHENNTAPKDIMGHGG